MSKKKHVRPQASELIRRLKEPRRFIQVISGPRQVGKTTLVTQVIDGLSLPCHFVSADEPTLRGSVWLEQQWETARFLLRDAPAHKRAILVIDEVQKIPNWAETVKRLWDNDTRQRRPLHVVMLGSAPLLVEQGLTESLAGRFETLRLPHWSFSEMRGAFGISVEEFVYYGSYPGAAPLRREPQRWSAYIRNSLIETTISRDVLLLSRVDKPALLRRLFELGCAYSGRILSYNKMLGQLQDAGNTTTLAHYLDLLAGAGMLVGLQKYAGDTARQRGSSPKLQVLNPALMTAASGVSLPEARTDSEYWGRLIESAVGAHLANAVGIDIDALHYWRDNNREVDFVARAGRHVTAIEVKSGRARSEQPGMMAFAATFPKARKLLVGADGIAIEDFLSRPVAHWVSA